MKKDIQPRGEIFSKAFNTVVTSIKGKEGMYYLRGSVVFDGEELPFRGVAFGRFGGHNVSIEFLKKTIRRLREKGLSAQEIQNFEIAIQVKILQGEMTVLQKGKEGH